jgi:hypothetical protein
MPSANGVLVEQVDPEPDDLLEAAPTTLHGAWNVPGA